MEPSTLLEIARRADDDEARWECVTQLHGRPSREVWEGAVRLCESPVAADRCLGADVLGQLGAPRPPFRGESIDVLLPMLRDGDATVVRCATVALGHLRADAALDDLVQLRVHPDTDVRHAVAFALLTLDDPRAVSALVDLSRDAEPIVRDWATFALGSLHDADTPEIREALASRLADGDDDTRTEALVGLATRRDARALAPLRAALEADSPSHVLVDAARALGSPHLLDALEALRERGWVRTSVDRRLLEHAIEACRPGIGG